MPRHAAPLPPLPSPSPGRGSRDETESFSIRCIRFPRTRATGLGFAKLRGFAGLAPSFEYYLSLARTVASRGSIDYPAGTKCRLRDRFHYDMEMSGCAMARHGVVMALELPRG